MSASDVLRAALAREAECRGAMERARAARSAASKRHSDECQSREGIEAKRQVPWPYPEEMADNIAREKHEAAVLELVKAACSVLEVLSRERAS